MLKDSYGYEPAYFIGNERGAINFAMPVMAVWSPLTGRRGVSLPYTDYCEPIISNGIPFQDLVESIIEHGRKSGWKSLELRSSSDLLYSTSSSLIYLGHVLDLSQGEGEVFSNFRDSTKRNAKKAMREGVEVKIHHSLESMKEFYRLNCMTRKEHGLPPQPFYFFKIVVIAVMSGFEGDLKARILGGQAQAILMRHTGPFTESAEALRQVASVSGFEAPTPFIYTQIMLRSPPRSPELFCATSIRPPSAAC